MALFTKLFPRFRSTQSHNDDKCSSEILCQFDARQVRLVLFRECDFRGRKLLFDSDATHKVPLEKKGENENFVEVHDGFGYTISKQNSDYEQLSEIIFGSVAMSFRGTYFKIHSLTEPFRLLFTQVFPSPQPPHRRLSSCSHQAHLSTRSIDHSIRLDDSGASSTYSSEPQMSDRSTRSTASDTVLVCKRRQRSSMGSGPNSSGILSKNSLIVDSGCGDNRSSFSSVSSGPLRFDTWESAVSYKGTSSLSLSSFTHLKHLYRSSSRSLHSSVCSLSNSTDDVIPRGHHRSSKLGLCLILDIPHAHQEFLTKFLMEHIALLESLMYRARTAIEAAYHKPRNFISSMVELSSATARWLVTLICGPRLSRNLWHCLSSKGCDSLNSISINSAGVRNKRQKSCGSRAESSVDFSVRKSDLLSRTRSCNFLENRSASDYNKYLRTEKREFNFSLGQLIKTDSENIVDTNFEDNFVAETFLNEFCEVLEEVDVKETNFFVSTLLTAVLTHHLGWVATCYPNTPGMSTFKRPYNALWSQLTDMYGAVGFPVKTAQTILTGSNKNTVITRILNSLTYFIRFSNIERKTVERSDVNSENLAAEIICTEANCIPKESYKKYEEHIREILVEKTSKPSHVSSKHEEIVNKVQRQLGSERSLSKVKTHSNLSAIQGELTRTEMIGEKLDNNVFDDIKGESIGMLSDKIKDKVPVIRKFKTLTKLSTYTADLRSICDSADSKCDVDFNENLVEDAMDNDVIFVLGDDDKLVNLKKDIVSREEPEISMNIKSFRTDKINIPNHAEQSLEIGSLDARIDYEVDTKKNITKYLPTSQKVGDQFKGKLYSKNNEIKLKSYSSCESLYENLPKFVSEMNPNTIQRCRSEPPESQPKFKYSRVKFNLQQYPEVVRNYMKSKNLQLEGLTLEHKIDDVMNIIDMNAKVDFSACDSDLEGCESLQTPSNASELEETSEIRPTSTNTMSLSSSNKEKLMNVEESRGTRRNALHLKARFQLDSTDGVDCQNATCSSKEEGHKSGWILGGSDSVEKNEEADHAMWLGGKTSKKNCDDSVESKNTSEKEKGRSMKIIELPMPKTIVSSKPQPYSVEYSSTVIKGLVDTFVPDMVLQGTTAPEKMWGNALKSNLATNAQHSLLDQPVEESLAILANTDTWEVQVISSHTYVIDKNASGVRVGMSQLVSNMLESLLRMRKSHIPPQHCLVYIENKLREFCFLSEALAQLLLASEFCSMELLTSTLHLEVNDVPLLMAVASTHTPQVTEKYGLSIQ